VKVVSGSMDSGFTVLNKIGSEQLAVVDQIDEIVMNVGVGSEGLDTSVSPDAREKDSGVEGAGSGDWKSGRGSASEV